jgi:hypothetical protein
LLGVKNHDHSPRLAGTQAVAEIKAQSGFEYTADKERQGQTRFWLQGEFPQYAFIDDMWKAYR